MDQRKVKRTIESIKPSHGADENSCSMLLQI